MANLSDLLARQSAAGGMMREAPNPEAGAPPEAGLPEEMAMPETEPGAEVENALGMLEAAIQAMDPALQEEIRTHVNAIREIATQDTGPAIAEQAPAPEGQAPEEPKIEV